MSNLSKLFMIRPDVVFLNHGSYGACPRPVFETYQEWQRELERQPLEFLGRRFGSLMQNARRELGDFIGSDPANIVYIPNTTTGLNMVAKSLALDAGDEVLTTDLEYGAMDRVWGFVCESQGAHYIRKHIPLPISGQNFIESLWDAVSARTKILFLSHITSSTALTFPISELLKRARKKGIITVIDGAHVPGQIPLDLEKLDVDFYAGNCHKWLLSPKGSAFLYSRPGMQARVRPLVISWGDKSLENSHFIQENEFQGTRDIAAFLTVPRAIEFFQTQHWTEVRENCHKLVLEARKRMIEISGLSPIAPENGGWFQQMYAQPLPPCDGEKLQKRLYDEYRVEIPITRHNGRDYIRISIQGYNTMADVDAFTNALEKLLPETCPS